MTPTDIVKRPAGRWLAGTGPVSDVALSTRVRLARNLADLPFPSRLNAAGAEEAVSRVKSALPARTEDPAGAPKTASPEGLPGKLQLYRLSAFTPLERLALVEKHLISPQHARRESGAAVVLSDDESVSIMVNEEDHLRIQCLVSGLELEEAWQLACRVDDLLERKLDYAFDPQLGYLTACPSNTGTGMRASVMVHLPALVMTHQHGAIFNALAKVGVVVRGLYGEGTEASGNIFQVSNQTTLGQPEQEVLSHLMGVSMQVIEHERAARERLFREHPDLVEDRVWRAYGILTSARSISSQEAMSLLSDLRLGIDLRVIPHVEARVFNELLVQISPAHLQVVEGRDLETGQRDIRRAALIRQRIKGGEARRLDVKP